MGHAPKTLPTDVESLQAIIVEERLVIAAQRKQIELLLKYKFGKKSEKRPRIDAGDEAIQGHLFHAELIVEAERTGEAKNVQGEIELKPASKAKKRGGRRSQFPSHLPQITTTYELEEDACKCANCGGQLHAIGEESSKELERLETALVHCIKRTKYGCRSCEEGVTTAPGPNRVIDKGLLGPGFLASVAVERFGNHMPYNRLEKKYAAEGLSLSRSVLERSMATCADILAPIAKQLRKEILAEPVIFTDDTGVTVAKPPNKTGSARGFVWIYLSRDGKHSYDFTLSRGREGPMAVLGEYKGFIHADAYQVYDPLFGPSKATEVACWAHTRRKFIDSEGTEPALAAEAVRRIAELYQIEREAKDGVLDDAARQALRQSRSVPIANECFAWMAKAQAEVLPKSPIGQALAYALRLETALREYLTDGRLEMDNNAAERALRAVAVGRKNWMFFQNENGGENATTMLSLVMTAKAAGINPRIYLLDVFLRISEESDITKLTPHGWRVHYEQSVETERQAAITAFIGG